MNKRRTGLVAVGVSGVMAAFGGLAMATRRGRRAVGGRSIGNRRQRIERSPQFHDEAFHNRRIPNIGAPDDPVEVLRRYRRGAALRRPPVPIPVLQPSPVAGERNLHVTWLGHAGALVELDGVRILLDPVWGERCSPAVHVGPRRLHAPPGSLADLAPVDAVVISHDHYDHLDMDTIHALSRVTAATFIVPLGVGAHLIRWSVPEDRIVELDWDESCTVGEVRLTAVEAQHFSGRGLRRNTTLWSSWVVAGPSGRVFFSGDTGYFDGYPRLAAEHGPFDAALMAIGMYDPAWRSVHLDPEEAVQASVELGARLVVPIHWCTFVLAPHPWAEPVERLLAAAADSGVTCVVPRVGERVCVAAPPPTLAWWRLPEAAPEVGPPGAGDPNPSHQPVMSAHSS